MATTGVVVLRGLVGPHEVAAMLGVAPNTVAVWRYRRLMPDPAGTLSGTPLWRSADVARWARRTGRLPAPPR